MDNPFGGLARKITIEVDKSGQQRITSWDYMVATGTTPENLVMLALPQKRQTDTRMLITQLIAATQACCQALFAAMEAKGGKLNGENETAGH
jgi:hypothetical protein